jgi:hypothetical protein
VEEQAVQSTDELPAKGGYLVIVRRDGRRDIYRKQPLSIKVAVGDPLTISHLELRDNDDTLIATWYP